MRQLVTLHQQSGRRGKGTLVLSLLSPIIQRVTPVHRTEPLTLPSLARLFQKHHQRRRCVSQVILHPIKGIIKIAHHKVLSAFSESLPWAGVAYVKPYVWLFAWCLGIWTRVFGFLWQALFQVSQYFLHLTLAFPLGRVGSSPHLPDQHPHLSLPTVLFFLSLICYPLSSVRVSAP